MARAVCFSIFFSKGNINKYIKIWSKATFFAPHVIPLIVWSNISSGGSTTSKVCISEHIYDAASWYGKIPTQGDRNERKRFSVYQYQPFIVVTHYCDVIMDTMASQITSLTIVYLTVYSDADQRIHQSSASLAFVWGIHRGPVNSPHKWPVTRKMFPFDDVIMNICNIKYNIVHFGTLSVACENTIAKFIFGIPVLCHLNQPYIFIFRSTCMLI